MLFRSEHATSLRGAVAAATSRDKRIDWATLLRRTYHLDALACPCGGRLRFLAVVTEHAAIVALLRGLGFPTAPLPVARARSPTLFDPDPPPLDA